MASGRSRQRALARAKVERQLARRAAKLRQRRQRTAIAIVSIVVVLGAVGTVWALGGFSKSKKPASTAASCTWNDAGTANNQLKDVGKPPASGEARTGTETMTITTGLGVISATVDLAKSPCTAASFGYLAGKHFFDNTRCHRVNPAQFLLQCGDPTGTGQGGPKYTYATEYVPTTPAPSSPGPSPSASDAGEGPTNVIYPAGSIATANQTADTNGSQFYIIYQDSALPPNYTLFGQVTAGLDIVKQIAAAGDDGAFANQGGGGHPKKEITIQTLVMGTAPASSGSPAPAPSASPSPSGSPSAKS